MHKAPKSISALNAAGSKLQSVRDRLPILEKRAAMIRATRRFFDERGFTEVDTPALVRVPGEELHLDPIPADLKYSDGRAERRYLHTSPEFAMKRVMAAVHQPIFQLCKAWRNGESGRTHRQEFTMLEWYRPHSDLNGLLDETEAYVRAMLPSCVRRNGSRVDIARPFERMTMAQAFKRYAGIDLLDHSDDVHGLADHAKAELRDVESWDDLFHRLFMERVESHLGRSAPTFITHWPASQAALARKDEADPRAALRAELFIAGVELANGFDELTDDQEQRKRFERDRDARLALYPDRYWPVDDDLLAALPFMPPCAGIALGFDRLVMLATNAPDIDAVQWVI